MKKLLCFILIVTLVLTTSMWQWISVFAFSYGDLPEARMAANGWEDVQWSDPGSWTTYDVTQYGLPVNDPNVDASQKVMDIVNTYSGNLSLYFPAGTYYFKTKCEITRDNVKLVGVGNTSTIFNIDAPSGTIAGIYFTGSISGTEISVSGTPLRGSNTIAVSDASTLSAGDFIWIYCKNFAVYPDRYNVKAQIVKITAKNSNTLTLDMNLGVDFPSAETPVVQKLNMGKNYSVEDLKIHRVRHNDGSHNIRFTYVYNARVKGIESSYASNHHVSGAWSRNIIVNDNYIHHGYDYGGGGHGYGVAFVDATTNSIVYNNTLYYLRHHFIASRGANHNVIAYNDCTVSPQTQNNISLHGDYTHNNLIEGNYSDLDIVHDGAYNQDGPYNWFFRNKGRKIGSNYNGNEKTGIVGNEYSTLASSGSDHYVGANKDDGTWVWGVLSSSSNIPASLYLTSQPGWMTYSFPRYGPQLAGPTPTPTPSGSEIIIDNTDSGYTTDSAWTSSTAQAGYYGTNYQHDGTSGSDASTRWAKWTPDIETGGNYNIYMRWTEYANRPDAAPLEIKYNGGLDTSKTVNQQTNGGVWVLIGNYNLSSGTGNYVKILATDVGYTIADVVKFVLTSSPTPTPTPGGPTSTPTPTPTPTPNPTPTPGSWNIIDDDLSNYSAGWGTSGTAGSVTQNTGYVTIVNDQSGANQYFFMTKNSFTPPTGAFTWEFRSKVNSSGTTNQYAVRSGNYLIEVYTTYGTSGSIQDRATSPNKTYTLDTTQYHTYRVVVHSNYTYDMYVNGSLAWSGATSNGTGGNIFKIGGGSNETANIDVDYVKMGAGEILP